MTLAFKEWSYIVEALGKGRQSIILRKGGIVEEGGVFSMQGNKFILFPTLFHQAEKMIKENWIKELRGDNFQICADKVKIEFFAEVAESKLITEWNILQKLFPYHAWKEEVVRERFNRWDKSVHLLIVQIYKLDKPFDLEIKPAYAGCKSWIELEEEIELTGRAVINKAIR